MEPKYKVGDKVKFFWKCEPKKEQLANIIQVANIPEVYGRAEPIILYRIRYVDVIGGNLVERWITDTELEEKHPRKEK